MPPFFTFLLESNSLNQENRIDSISPTLKDIRALGPTFTYFLSLAHTIFILGIDTMSAIGYMMSDDK